MKTGVKPKNLIGKKFNRLTVISYFGRNNRNELLWNCICDCGGKNIVKTYFLVHNQVKSCGCFGKENIKIINELTKKKYENLRKKEIGQIYNNCEILNAWACNAKQTFVQVKCFCGNIFESKLNHLRRKDGKGTKSCGCLREKYTKQIIDFYEKNGYYPGYIYKITNKINGKFYIGKTNNFQKRKSDHKKNLKKDKHSNSKLQKDFNEYGLENFSFEIIKTYKLKNRMDTVRLLENYEKFYIKKLKPFYNVIYNKEV